MKNMKKYIQIAEILEKRITEGVYAENSKLPPHRELAEELNVAPATVAKAYQLLIDKKRIQSVVGRGTFVLGRPNLSKVIKPNDSDVDYNFSILQPCLYKNVPFIKEALASVGESLSSELIGYTEHSGHETHRQAGVDWAKSYGLEGGNSNNTLLFSGAQHALSLLMNMLSNPNDNIAAEALTYPGILAIANLSGRSVIGIEMDDKGMIPECLDKAIQESNIKLVVISPSHQNPTGITMPESRRKEIADIVNKHKIWLIEDDIYCFLDQNPIPAITNFAPEYGFHITGLSKVISPAIRCAYVKVPDKHVSLVGAHIRANIWLSSPINFAIASYLINTGNAFEIASMQRQIANKRQAYAREIFKNITYSSSGYHIWLPIPDSWKLEHLIIEAKQRDIIISSGSYFDVSGKHPSHIRLSLMSINDCQRLKEGLTKLNELLNINAHSLFPY